MYVPHTEGVNPELVEQFNPDLVLMVIVERLLEYLPSNEKLEQAARP